MIIPFPAQVYSILKFTKVFHVYYVIFVWNRRNMRMMHTGQISTPCLWGGNRVSERLEDQCKVSQLVNDNASTSLPVPTMHSFSILAGSKRVTNIIYTKCIHSISHSPGTGMRNKEQLPWLLCFSFFLPCLTEAQQHIGWAGDISEHGAAKGERDVQRAQLDDNSEVHALRQSKPLQENLCWRLSLESTLSINSIPLVRGNWSWESEHVQDGWAFCLSCQCWILVMSSEPHVDGLGETLFCSRQPSGLLKDRLF